MKRLILFGVAALVAMGVSASSAMAGEYVITANGAPYTGNVHAELEGGGASFTTGAGQSVPCNQSHLTGTITNSEAGPGSTINGAVTTWVFLYNGSSFCPSTIPGTSSCEVEVANLPYTIRVNTTNHASPTFVLNNVLIVLHCNTFIGRVECEFSAATVTGTWVGDEIRIVNQTFAGHDGFPCPAGLNLTATYDLRTTGSNFPVTLVEQ